VVAHQLQVERKTGKVRQSQTDVLPLCYATNLGKPVQTGKTSLDLNDARDDGFWDAVASAGPYANNLHLAPDR